MKIRRKTMGDRQEATQADSVPPAPFRAACRRAAFTLIEIMVVVSIMGMVMAMGFPAIYRVMHQESLTKAVNDVIRTCERARTQAILSGRAADAVFYPLDKRMEAGGGSRAGGDDFAGETGSATAVSSTAAQLPNNITLEMLDVNFVEYKEAEEARVRFYPNGTCDEMTVVLRSDRNQYRKITLEITTGLPSVEAIR